MKIWLKIRLVLIILILVGGVAFLIFAVFLNRAELSITATAPFDLGIMGQQGINCDQSPCSVTLAPGKYYLTLDKDGYQQFSDEVELKLGQKLEKNYRLIQTPHLDKLPADSEEAKTFMADPLAKLTADLPQNITYFKAPSSDNVYFLADNPQTFLPSLYLKNTARSDQPPQLLVNFLRTMKKTLLRVNPEETRLIVIDQSDPQNAALYLIDLQDKTRKLIDQNTLITDALWLPAQTGTPQYLLLEKINRDSLQPELFELNLDNPALQTPLSINTRLSAATALGPEEILYAEPFQEQPEEGNVYGFTLKTLNLKTVSSQDIFDITEEVLPQKIEFRSKNKILLMLIDGNVYSLSPIL
jgi:hypothetical protein